MTPSYHRPRALVAALSFVVISIMIAIAESTLLLTVQSGMLEQGGADLRGEAEELRGAIHTGVVGSMGISLLGAAGIVISVLAKPAGRILLFLTTSLSTGWHLMCGGCLFAAPRTSDLSDEILQYYTMWTYEAAILCGFAAGITAAIGLICLAQRSVGHYFRGIQQR